MARLTRRLLTACLLLAALSAAALPPTMRMRGDSVRVSLVTFAPGSDNYALFGHAELRLVDSLYDAYFNYGVFDFATPNFLYRFAAGETDYMCVAMPVEMAMDGNEGRKMTEQVLNLTHDEAVALRTLLWQNVQPLNREYRYRYFSDNCATRPRDVVEQVVTGGIHYTRLPLERVTLRDVMRRYTRNYPWEQFGIDLVLGAPCDTVITQRQLHFIPMLLHDAVAGATVERNGRRVPLVTHENVMVPGSDAGTVLPPTPWWRSPMAAMCLVLALSLAVSVGPWRRGRAARCFDTLLFVALALVGIVVWFIAFISTHEATAPNYNALWLSPLLLLPAILVWCPRAMRWLLCCHAVELALTLTTATVWAAGLQAPNAAFWPLAAAVAARSLSWLLPLRHHRNG